MKTVMNFTTCYEDTNRYRDQADLKRYLKDFALDGLEVLEAGADTRQIIDPKDAVGVHLKYYPGWMDFWTGDEARLMIEYGDWDACVQHYGGRDRQAMIEAYRKNLQFVNRMQPEYMVLHVADCSMIESMRRVYHYTDAQVVDATCELMNQVTDTLTCKPWLLYENLWYPGLNMLDPDMVQRLMANTHYPKCGVMLDTGHIMHTNPDLRTPDEAVDHIHRVLDLYPDLDFIKGIHLSQSLTGEHAKALMQTWQPVEGDYQTRIWEVMGHIFEIDTHKPFTTHRVRELVERIQPEYLVLELITGSREEHAGLLAHQLHYLRD